MNLESVVLQGRYEIIEKIGSGGMSNVFRSKDLKLGRLVAIKVLKDEFCSDASFVERFKREAQAAAGLLGENIVNIYDVVDEGKYHFIVMELVDGITLKEYIKIKGKLDITEGVSIAIQVAKALKIAHAQHIVHRDIKPQNILITEDSKIKVADFGIARAVSEQTVNANAIGSVHYISPEQARGGRCDARSDIYSLGITMYEMFAGRVPFTGDSTVAIALAHLEQSIIPPSVYNNRITPNLERIILKCTKKDPANRYQNITSVLDELENVLLNPEEPYEVSGATKVMKAKETAILNQVEPIDDMEYEEDTGSVNDDYENNEQDDDDYDEEDEKMDKILSIVGVIIAVIIVILLVFFVGRFTGVFGGKKTDISQSTLDSTQTIMPEVTGLSEKMADKKLSDNNLQMQVKSSEYSDTVEKGNVISQEPKAGETVSKYSKVSVVISLGSDTFDISKLNLSGKTKEAAEALLKENGFSVDSKEENSDTVEKGMVMSYSPIKPKKGERVTLTVSSGKKITKVVVPNITNMNEADAKALLESSGLVPGKKAEQNSQNVAAGIIVGQSVEAGSSIDSGSAIDYAVSTGVSESSESASESSQQPSTEQASTKATVAPSTAAASYRYVASIDTNYSLQDVIGPSSGLTSVKVMIRLRQTVNGSDVYSTLMDARTVTGDTILPVRFRTIVGANGVDQGQVEIVNVDSGEVLKSYTVEFFKVE
nr:Stk1 family PASTA domain-containing Ser/Thr kinase [uncultured Lachnoanaerobaculum sp.]